MDTERQRITIALYISETDNVYSNAILEGACKEAEKQDVNLIVFPVKYLNPPYVDKEHMVFKWQSTCMLSYAMNKSVDGVIVDAGSIGSNVSSDKMKKFLNRYTGVPVISIAKEIDGYPCLDFSSDGIKDQLKHLYYHHGRRKIGIINGPLSASDAVNRFRAYKEALAECGLEYDARRVGEGKFTNLDDAYIEEMLERCNYDIDALMFANDDMATAGYRVLEKHGLKVGRDVLVTGFDDSPRAMEVEPPLTTIRIDTRKLGVQAVDTVIEMIATGKPDYALPKGTLILRGSCGCKSVQTITNEELSALGNNENLTLEECRTHIHNIIVSCLHTQGDHNGLVVMLTDFFYGILSYAAASDNDDCFRALNDTINNTMDYDMVEGLVARKIFEFLPELRKRVSLVAIDTVHIKNALGIIDSFFNLCYDKLVTMHLSVEENKKRIIWRSNNFMDVAISSVNDTEFMYHQFLYWLREMSIQNAYFYIHQDPIQIQSLDDWQQPDYEILYAYTRNGGILITPDEDKIVSADMLFKNHLMPDHRATFCVAPLFFSESNYGFIMGETDYNSIEFFERFISSMLSDAIKFSNMYTEQIAMMQLLEKNLHKTTNILKEIQGKNENLSRITKYDEMTGIYNRRGFLEEVVTRLENEENIGKKAAVIFADMDNLKKVNDQYGHANGDIAIKTTAKILTLSMRGTDIVARFGGDEFAAFALFAAEGFEQTFRERVEAVTEAQNKLLGKPYYVSTSLGIQIFTITEDTDLNEEMKRADELLYEDKRRRKMGRI